MTTITPTSTTIPLTATLTQPLHHGAGSSGNTSMLRTEEVVQPDGTHARVPFVSANSIRHGIRSALAWHAVETLGIQDGTLTKGEVDLLWSGGAVTTTGAQTNLDLSRKIEALYPALGLLGFAAQSDIYAGTLRVSPLILVARENAWRLPGYLAGSPHAKQGAAAYRGEEFGTRHDVAATPVDRLVDLSGQITGTTQMIYDIQVLKAGSVLHGDVQLTPSATERHRVALGAALALWAPEGIVHLGAKTAVGFGRARIDLPDTTADLEALTVLLSEHRDEALALITEVAG